LQLKIVAKNNEYDILKEKKMGQKEKLRKELLSYQIKDLIEVLEQEGLL